MILATTLSLAAAAALINVWHFVRIVRVRLGDKIVHGDGGNEAMARRMRAHSNFIEHAPLFLILCGLIEATSKGGLWLAVAGGVFMLASNGSTTVAAALGRKMAYDIRTDFVAVAPVGIDPMLLLVRPDLQVKDAAEPGDEVLNLPPGQGPFGRVVVARPEALDLVKYMQGLDHTYPVLPPAPKAAQGTEAQPPAGAASSAAS